ncbi:uncharacterized protein KY384_006023 [Bacidia gigantensis]|uniref:uncharacterized protein n=1 Tax=Bacidia gigantensis TaxID=2732470 RepID=UPI001D039C2E|nr:uncharacterized protein KY384_006023 [Bacidia gigantensis]KAG8529387.1 hypothetical protein KY384_006023 [Bacidia gigantensis]
MDQSNVGLESAYLLLDREWSRCGFTKRYGPGRLEEKAGVVHLQDGELLWRKKKKFTQAKKAISLIVKARDRGLAFDGGFLGTTNASTLAIRISNPAYVRTLLEMLTPRFLQSDLTPYPASIFVQSGYYHSSAFEQPSPYSPSKSAILSSALKHVPAHGFTEQSLRLGAQDAGFLPISTNLFPDGAFSLVSYHLTTQRLSLSNQFQRPDISPATNEAPSDMLQRLQTIALHRLHANIPYISQYQSALALLSLPSNVSSGLKELARLADEILYLAGSTTVTTAWFTDRAALASIYASAELYMTQDKSKGFVETDAFLQRRLDEADKVRRAGGMVGQWVGMQVGGLIDGLRSKGAWI